MGGSYPKENLEAIYRTIISERQKVAAEIENETQLYEKSAVAKGMDEAQKIYDTMYKTDSSFYEFFRTIKMYEKLAKEKNGDMTITIPIDSPVGKVLMGY